MKIYSKFTDYYDNATCYQICGDDQRIFKRKTKHIELPSNLFGLDWHDYINDHWYDNKLFHVDNWAIIGFCGELYPCVVNGYDTNISYFYSPKAVSKLLTNHAKKLKKKNKQLFDKQFKSEFSQVEKTFNKLRQLNHLKDLFTQYEVPIFYTERGRRNPEIITNPNLQDLGFTKMFNNYQARQELEMYISTIQVKEDDPMQITNNEVLRDSKGFNEWSFKNQKNRRK